MRLLHSIRAIARAAVLAIPLALVVACASRSAGTPPDRALFRLPVTGSAVEPARELSVGVGIIEDDGDGGGPVVPAYSTSFRFVRGDGTTLLAPRLTTVPAQRANVVISNQFTYVKDFDVEVSGDAWIADPVIDTLHSGWTVELTVLDAAGSETEAALAFHVRGCEVRRPIATRTIEALSPRVAQPVTIQMPRWETASASGARRLPLGVETEIARLPDPAGSGEFVLVGRVDRVAVPAPRPGEDPPADFVPPGASAEDEARWAALRALGATAARGERAGTLSVSAFRLPPGTTSPDAAGAARLVTLSLRSVLAPGASVANGLHESWLGFDVIDLAGGGVCDPTIGVADSGLDVDVLGPGSFGVTWGATPTIEPMMTAPFHRRPAVASGQLPDDRGFRFPFDVVKGMNHQSALGCESGRTVHPMFRLADGGTAVLVVEWGMER